MCTLYVDSDKLNLFDFSNILPQRISLANKSTFYQDLTELILLTQGSPQTSKTSIVKGLALRLEEGEAENETFSSEDLLKKRSYRELYRLLPHQDFRIVNWRTNEDTGLRYRFFPPTNPNLREEERLKPLFEKNVLFY